MSAARQVFADLLLQQTHNILLYGRPGIGKTWTASTISSERMIYIGTEQGGIDTLASLHRRGNYDFSKAEIYTPRTMLEIEQVIKEAVASTRPVLFIDSLSEIADICLAEATKAVGAKYGADSKKSIPQVLALLELAFQHKGLNIFTAREEKISLQDFTCNDFSIQPSVPAGKGFSEILPHKFSNVFALHSVQTTEGTDEKFLQTVTGNDHLCKTRCINLDPYELPDWRGIYSKLMQVRKPAQD